MEGDGVVGVEGVQQNDVVTPVRLIEEGAAIGLIFEGRRVVDYDGVFELPIQAVKLLEAAGYDPAEVMA